jgi:hypothetical protein
MVEGEWPVVLPGAAEQTLAPKTRVQFKNAANAQIKLSPRHKLLPTSCKPMWGAGGRAGGMCHNCEQKGGNSAPAVATLRTLLL